jgi:hypothetical protein
MSNFIINKQVDITELPEYHAIQRIIDSVVKNGLLDRFTGNCIGASDLLSSMLRHEGIESKMVECFLSIKNTNHNPPIYNFIGYDGLHMRENQFDVHLVVVTKTKVPILIDLSIAHVLPETVPYIVGKVSDAEDTFGEYYIEGVELRYNIKKTPKLPALHQKTIVEKIREDEAIREKLKQLQLGITILAIFAAINFTLNMTAVILKMIYL